MIYNVDCAWGCRIVANSRKPPKKDEENKSKIIIESGSNAWRELAHLN